MRDVALVLNENELAILHSALVVLSEHHKHSHCPDRGIVIDELKDRVWSLYDSLFVREYVSPFDV